MTIETTTLPGGLRVITDSVPSVESVAIGIWADVGTRHENLAHNGVAHMVEHMMFKGTPTRSAAQIAEEIENVGGHMNAYTSREVTAYHIHLLREHMPLALNVLSDIIQNPTLPEEEIARERGVIVQEIGMTLDATVALLEKAGATIEPVTLPEPDVLSIFEMLWFSSAANRVSQFDAEERQRIDPALMEAAALPHNWSAVDYVRATNQRTAFGLRMDALLEKFDLLISPATALLPFKAGEEKPPGMRRWTEWASFSFPLNLSQQPAIVVPCGRTAGGLPIGAQFVAARGDDAKAIAAAQAFEALHSASFL